MTLTLIGVAISLPGRLLLRRFDLTIGPGEIVTLMGPSGSGKSSLLSLIGGDLELPLKGEGRVLVGAEDVTLLAPERRRIGRLFQDDLLFPHLTVAENLLFGMPRAARESRLIRLRDALSSAGLAGFEDRPPHTLSGGQRARVSLLRALLAEPRAMLLDEPFNRLDAELRAAFRSFVFAELQSRGVPTLLVTHDIGDAAERGRVLKIGAGGEVRDA